jgi:hypothetical protein
MRHQPDQRIDNGHCLSLGMFFHQRLTNIHNLSGIGLERQKTRIYTDAAECHG